MYFLLNYLFNPSQHHPLTRAKQVGSQHCHGQILFLFNVPSSQSTLQLFIFIFLHWGQKSEKQIVITPEGIRKRKLLVLVRNLYHSSQLGPQHFNIAVSLERLGNKLRQVLKVRD